jgi:DNA-binding LacI/PurR family transcriptional regulator
MSKKVFIFLPDGVGLRNFAFTDFKEIGENKDFQITYWNNTPFELNTELGFAEVKMQSQKIHPFTTIFTRARKRAELNYFDQKFNETVYNTYNFPQSYKGIINFIKSSSVDVLVAMCSNNKGIDFIRNQIKRLERKSAKYQQAKIQLQEHKPDFIFCTNQRPSQAIAPILAAQDLKIPTAAFIFSWDNLPKATTLGETD